jgi:hypothetical protein
MLTFLGYVHNIWSVRGAHREKQPCLVASGFYLFRGDIAIGCYKRTHVCRITATFNPIFTEKLLKKIVIRYMLTKPQKFSDQRAERLEESIYRLIALRLS